MNIISYIYLFFSVAFNVASYLIYKSISAKQNDFFWLIMFIFGLMLGGINIYLFTKAIKNIKLSIAYPIFSGACITLMIILSSLIFQEKLNIINIIGAFLVIAGIIFLSV